METCIASHATRSIGGMRSFVEALECFYIDSRMHFGKNGDGTPLVLHQ